MRPNLKASLAKANKRYRNTLKKLAEERKPKYILYNLKPLKSTHTAILCLDCGWIRASFGVHDYRVCPCPNQAMVDGGWEYVRYGAKDLKRIQLFKIKPEKD